MNNHQAGLQHWLPLLQLTLLNTTTTFTPWPSVSSFDKETPFRLELSDEVVQARHAVLEATIEFQALMLGPLESLQDQTSRVSQSGLYAVIVDNAFTASECASLVRTAEVRAGGKWEHAMIDVGHGVQELDTTVRSCGRIVCDDQEIAEKTWARVKDAVPEVEVLKDWPEVTGKWACRLKEVWKMTRLNERLRFLKYGPGEYFRPHCDGLYTIPDCQEASFFTLHLYLNKSDPVTPGGKLEGGATTFHGYDFEEMDSWDESGEVQKRLDVVPKMGRVLIFQQRDLLHSGDDVTAGTKLTMRTDLMYKRAEN